ncbi:MAG: hypothetical protein H9882_00680 [Candidatus Fournierella pullistercoris]|uniref:Uncharacterized protein n=1 Tax=Candidatus Allofournierella pullistercoris TaxID=2838597 RepID=A0A948T026_9FIRM|nr:hypothetical protein [Candidatus Fournierella pullistercoris]
MEKIQLTQFAALSILFGIMVISELVAKSTGGKVPGAFTISVLLLAGYWTILPTDLMETAGLTPTLFSMVVSMLVTHLGTLIGRQQMISH